MVPRLPPELTDRIIDFVSGLIWHERIPTLYSCALTCRAWLPASLFHLYGDEIYVLTHKHFEALVRGSRIPHISNALRSVRALTLIDEEKPKHAWVHRFVLTLGHTFAAIKELRIAEIKWDEVNVYSAIPSVGLAHFRCVTKLHLRWCSFRSFRQFQCIVCAFPQLRDLTVEDVETPSSPTFSLALRLPPLTHLYLALHPDDFTPYYQWFASMSFQPSLQTVCLHADMQTLQDVGVILQNHARRLEEVTLYFDSDIPPSSLYKLNVHRCAALRRLDLQSIPHVSLAGVLDLVSPESRIHTLEISLFLGSTEPEWERASRMLEDERFCALREFKLCIQNKVLYQDEEAPQRIDTTFDPLRHRGVSVDVELSKSRRRPRPPDAEVWKPRRRPPDAEYIRRLEGLRFIRLRSGAWMGRQPGFV